MGGDNTQFSCLHSSQTDAICSHVLAATGFFTVCSKVFSNSRNSSAEYSPAEGETSDPAVSQEPPGAGIQAQTVTLIVTVTKYLI